MNSDHHIAGQHDTLANTQANWSRPTGEYAEIGSSENGNVGNRKFSAKQLINRAGRLGVVAAITLVSIALSICITAIFLFSLQTNESDFLTPLLISAAIPSIVAPTTTWYCVGLLMKTFRLEEEMRYLATYDTLTGLLGRRAFLERCEQMLRLSRRQQTPGHFVIVDLDDFKQINDLHGHAGGDSVLAAFGEAVRNTLRESDCSGRYGGEEFAFYLPNTSPDQAIEVLDRLQKTIKTSPVKFAGNPIRYTVSMGVAQYTHVETLRELVDSADIALYHAKRNGKDRTTVFTEVDPKNKWCKIGSA